MSTRVFVLVVGLLAAALAGTVTAGYFIWRDGQQAGAALIGGAFELVDQNGEAAPSSRYDGDWLLVYFGYTYCPDVCPTELTKMTQALDELGPLAERIQPLFITVDPERDTVEALAGYHEHFHPSFDMLTGSPERIREAARAYRVYYAKAETEEATEYLMDHSSIVYLMAPGQRYAGHFGADATPAEIASAVRKKLAGS